MASNCDTKHYTRMQNNHSTPTEIGNPSSPRGHFGELQGPSPMEMEFDGTEIGNSPQGLFGEPQGPSPMEMESDRAWEMPYIPPELHLDILVRLPAESLFRFRCVCKAWLGIIDDPSFIRAHTNNQLYSHTLLLGNTSTPTLYSFSLDSLNYINAHQMIDATRIKLPFDLEENLFDVASCNGLILTPACRRIWNPLTGDSHQIRQPDIFDHSDLGFGFGYDGDADDYKVVRIHISPAKFVCQTIVYSLKSDSWSMIQDCPGFPLFSLGTFWNGALYWPSYAGVISLHLGTNSYCMLPLPPAVNCVGSFHLTLDALGGSLICSWCNYTSGTFDGWVMKDNGVEKSWIKLISLQYSPNNISPTLKLVAYLSSKEQVLMQIDSHFSWFDIRNNSVLKFSIHGIPDIDSSRICPGSLVRLNVRGRASELGADGRLKLCVRGVGEKRCSYDFCCGDMCRVCKMMGRVTLDA